jgi:hypothetical protein
MDYPSILAIGRKQITRSPDVERGQNAAYKCDGNQAVSVALMVSIVFNWLSLEGEVDGGLYRTEKLASLRRSLSERELRANRSERQRQGPKSSRPVMPQPDVNHQPINKEHAKLGLFSTGVCHLLEIPSSFDPSLICGGRAH